MERARLIIRVKPRSIVMVRFRIWPRARVRVRDMVMSGSKFRVSSGAWISVRVRDCVECYG